MRSEERFRHLAENAPDMLYRYRLDPSPGFEYVSPAATRLTGHGPEHFYADPEAMLRAAHPDDRARVERLLAHADPADGPVEIRLVRPDGQVAWTEHRIVPIYGEQGQLVAVEGIARDISKRKRAEDEVRLLQLVTVAVSQSRDVQSALFMVLREVCRATGWAFGQAWIPNADHSTLLCGPAWAGDRVDRVAPFRQACLEFQARPGTGLLGLAWESRHPIWVRDVSAENFPRASIASQVGFKAAMAIPVLGDGRVVAICEFFLFEPREEDERLVGVVSAVATHLGGAILRARMEEELQAAVRFREQMMAELERRNHQLQALFLNMAEGVVAVDEEGRLLMVNPAATSLLGQPGPFTGLELAAAGLPEPLVGAIQAACRSVEPGMTETRFRCGGAEIRALVSPMVQEQGQVYGAVALLQDVTMEERLKWLRENFVANVSHELRGPLAALSAGVEAMHDGLIPPDSRPRYLKAMLAEIARLRRLTDSLLELSRIDAGMMQIPIEEFDLAPLGEALVETWGPRAASAGVELVPECPHLRVMGNVDRVEEVLTNFLDNAIRHTKPGGRVRLFARPEGEMVRLGVSDTGVGIEPVHLPHIWDRFYKTDPARTRTPDRGTGLGLSICKQLVELMGGEVSVESEPGVGSTFSFTLVAGRA
ncbi:MAG: PAS domain-containing sensor histidine kinase [Bacillota bacterium]